MKFGHSNSLTKKLAVGLLPFLDYVKIWFNRAEIVIHGSYYTTNVGDRAIGIVLKNGLRKKGVKSILVSRFCTNPPVRNIIVGGGGIIHSNYEKNLFLRTSFVDGKRNVVYIGVGCPGFDTLSKEDQRNISRLAIAKYVSVRDQFSKNVLISKVNITPEVLACPAWLISRNLEYSDISLRNYIFRLHYNLKYYRKSRLSVDKSREKIGVVLTGLFDLRWLPSVKKMMTRLSEEADLYFIPFAGEDIKFYHENLSDLRMSCLKLRGPSDTYRVITKMDRVIANRYHSLIFALLANKPVMALAYSQKIVSLANDLHLRFTNLSDDSCKVYEFDASYSRDLINEKISEAEAQVERTIENLQF